ncbi:MAG: DUF1304 domain-containing protein [Chloracidobacterium sp.]|nr:DUF1304 domain-containing protein [Chloracidobacterium sp.]
MKILSHVLTLFVVIEHLMFLLLEMFFWDHPIGRQMFGMTVEASAATRVLAANQGLYNGFLAAGLVWGIIARRTEVRYFFLGCIIVAGIYGGYTAKASIFVVQALPAALALAATIASHWGIEGGRSTST